MDDDDDDNDDADYKDNASDGDNDDGNDDEVPGADADSPEDEISRLVHLLSGVVRTNQDYGLGSMVPLPDSSAAAPAAFKAMELQASMFFASCSLVRAGGFSEEDRPICFCCLHCNLMPLFLWCNRDSWSGCRHCSYT